MCLDDMHDDDDMYMTRNWQKSSQDSGNFPPVPSSPRLVPAPQTLDKQLPDRVISRRLRKQPLPQPPQNPRQRRPKLDR